MLTEPFSEWVLAGEFPGGRPAWEAAGARVVDDVEPFEQRKLWLLNGSHSLLAYAGHVRGHETVAEAIADPVVRGWVEQWWDEAAAHLTLPPSDVAAYREALLERFANPRIRHLLAQIAADGSQKIPVRILPDAAGRAGRRRGSRRARPGWSRPGSATCAASVRRSTTRAPPRWPRSARAPSRAVGGARSWASSARTSRRIPRSWPRSAHAEDLTAQADRRVAGRPRRCAPVPTRGRGRHRPRRRDDGHQGGRLRARHRLAATACASTRCSSPQPGWQVQDPRASAPPWSGRLAEGVAAVEGAPVVAVSVSTAMHGLIGLDDERRAADPD